MSGKISAICISARKGAPKTCVDTARIEAGHGIAGDVHAGKGPRQVSILLEESLDTLNDFGMETAPGDFAENLIIKGIVSEKIKKGDRIVIKDDIVLEVTQIGKVCHDKCGIFEKLGRCAMADEGIFAAVISGGTICPGDSVEIER
ncbi:MAG: MOSC domain-containing protein [Elusimicrobiota bacterium]